MHRLLPLAALLLSAAPAALAGFAQPVQKVKLAYGQKKVVLTFKADSAITRAKSLCDCTTVSYSGNVLTAYVDISKFDQTVDKQVEAATADGKTTKLTMHFDVPPAVVLSSRSLVWPKGSPATPQTLHIRIPKGSPVSDVVEAGLNGKAFDFRTKRLKTGSEYAVDVTPLSTATPVLNRLVIKTRSSDPRFSRFIIYLQVKK